MKYFPLLLLLIMVSCTSTKSNEKSEELLSEKIAEIEKVYAMATSDSLMGLLIGTSLDNFQFEDVEGKKLRIADIEKPIFLEATASWCKPCKALVPALNEIVEQYHDRVEFVLLTHDTQEKVQKFSEILHPEIRIIPSKSSQNSNSLSKLDVGEFKQIFPFPTTYFVDANKTIVDVKVGAPLPKENTEKGLLDVKEYNVQALGKSIEKMLN